MCSKAMADQNDAPSLGDDSFDVLRKAKAASLGPEGGSARGSQVAAALNDMRRRVLGTERAGLPSADLEPEERAAVTERIRETMQVNLDVDERALQELEDPDLLAHMAAARRRLAAHMRSVKSLPTEGDLHIRYTSIMSRMSELMRGLDGLEGVASDGGAVAGKRTQAVAVIRSGGTPRNCPENPLRVVSKPMFEVLDFVHTESKKTSDAFMGVADEIKAIRLELFRLRRDVETMGDGYVSVVKAQAEERSQLRNLLAINAKR